MRADQLLVERGLAVSRSQAQRLIAGGLRWFDGINWRTVAKNRDEVPDDARIELLDDAEARYVSRGGLKLEGALVATGFDVSGLNCLDVGQSTGGFTDCLLARGAAHVTGVDVGSAQLNEKLRADPRVTAIEGVNARSLTVEDLSPEDGEPPEPFEPFDLAVGDLSFISLTLVLPAVAQLVKPGGSVLFLVKPQFELTPQDIGKGGLVRDVALYPRVEERIRQACAALGLVVKQWLDSPIEGGDGNREFFVLAAKPE